MVANRMRAKSGWRGGAISGTVVSGMAAGEGGGGGAAAAISFVFSFLSSKKMEESH